MDLEQYIRDVPDFPKPGIVFKDITPLLADAAAMQGPVTQLTPPRPPGPGRLATRSQMSCQ